MRDFVGGVKSAVTALSVVLVLAVVLLLLVATFIVGIGTIVGYVGNMAGPQSGGAPSATFGVGGIDGEATVVHEGGDQFPADELLITVDGDERGTWADHDGTGETVTEGDSIAIDDVHDGDEVVILWIGGGGEEVELYSETV